MTRTRKLYLVSYDIREDGRLRRVFKIMRGYGDHLQYSVFRCVLSDVQLAELKGRLGAVIRPSEDQVLIVPLGSADAERSWRMTTLGQSVLYPARSVRVIV